MRQGFTPLFDVPIEIENPEEPLGTHVFTLLDFQNEGASFRWTVVSMPENFGTSPSANKQRNASVHGMGDTTRPDPLKADRVSAALDRI